MSTIKRLNVGIYSDEECTKPIDNPIDVGLTREGENVDQNLWIRNNERDNILNIEYKTNNEHVVIKGPLSLVKDEVAPLTISWKPPIDSETGLRDTLEIEGDVIIR